MDRLNDGLLDHSSVLSIMLHSSNGTEGISQFALLKVEDELPLIGGCWEAVMDLLSSAAATEWLLKPDMIMAE